MDNKTNNMEEPVLSEKDERLLKYLALIAGAMQQQATAGSSKNEEKTFRKALREPAVIAALITAIVASAITGFLQYGASRRDFKQSQLKAASDQGLIQYTKYLEQEQALITRVYALVGTCTAAGDNVKGLTREKWQKVSSNSDQISVIIKTYNATRTKWISEALELEQLMGYYHPNQSEPSQPSEVLIAWRKIPDSMQDYFGCIDVWFEENRPDKKHAKSYHPPTEQETTKACRGQYDHLMANLNVLTSRLSSAQPKPSVAPTQN